MMNYQKFMIQSRVLFRKPSEGIYKIIPLTVSIAHCGTLDINESLSVQL